MSRTSLACALLLVALTLAPVRADEPLLVVGGRLLGRDPGTGLLIEGERIAKVGPEAELRAAAGAGARVLDAAGGLVLPGFHDAHTHLLAGGLARLRVDLAGARTVEEAAARVRAYAAAHPDEPWILGRGWSYDLAPAGQLPGRAPLDAAVPDRPVALEAYDGHATWANSRALALAGIDADTPDPEGGRIVREQGGAPAGVLLERAERLLTRAIPAPDRAARRRALEAALAHYLELGITSAQTIVADLDELALYEELRAEGRLPIRVTAALPLGGDLDEYARLRERHRTGRLQVGWLKGFLDGVIEARTAYMLAPYSGAPPQDQRGAPLIEPARLRELVSAAHGRGFSVGLHAIGDAAVRLALDAFAEARRRHPERAIRHRIEHIEVCHPEDMPRFAALDVVASMQPYHAYPGESPSTADVWSVNLGPERLRRSFPWRDLLAEGATLAFGSDWPVMSADPLRGLAVAITRRNEAGLPEGGWQGHQATSFAEAVRGYTAGAAYSLAREDELGRLEPGHLADLVVLSPEVDPARPKTLWRGHVRAVIVGGEVAR